MLALHSNIIFQPNQGSRCFAFSNISNMETNNKWGSESKFDQVVFADNRTIDIGVVVCDNKGDLLADMYKISATARNRTHQS